MTLEFDCPWCGDALSASMDAPSVRCATCAVSVDLADPVPAISLRPVAVQCQAAAAA